MLLLGIFVGVVVTVLAAVGAVAVLLDRAFRL